MSTALTPGQRALLESELQVARQRLEHALNAQLGGDDRVAHAAALLADDPSDWREHAPERALDNARCDHLLTELHDIYDAQLRIGRPGYGQCLDCAATIPFDRLQRQPQALRCLDCQTAAEAAA
jgi:RNA polymerase-binding transcription factor DksA